MERVIDQPPPEQHLLERILATENMELAWKRVRANKGAPGVDGITIDAFPDRFRPLWSDIRASLATGSYLPKPVLRVEIPKPTGGFRPLGIPTVLDRLIQQSIAQILTPIFDPDFSESSFGFRPTGQPIRLSGNCGSISGRATGLPWTSTLPSSSTRSITICS